MRKLTRRSYNRKLIVFGLAIFLAFGMISTGFAAWLISSAATEDAEAPVEVDKIVDESFELTIDQLDEAGTDWDGALISFDAKKDDTTGRVQFQPNGENDGGEQLELELSGTVTNVAALGKQPDGNNDGVLKIEITLPDSLKNAITEKYLTVSYTVGASGSVTTLTSNTLWVKPVASENGEGTFSITLKFGWGEKFNGKNPCEYYDLDETGKAVTDTDMKAELEAFRLTLVGPLTGDENALTKAYKGEIKFTVTAAASYGEAASN